jgi:hypothetical protein
MVWLMNWLFWLCATITEFNINNKAKEEHGDMANTRKNGALMGKAMRRMALNVLGGTDRPVAMEKRGRRCAGR